MLSRDFPSISVTFPCCRGLSDNFCQLSIWTFRQLPCDHKIFCQLLSTLCVAAGPSVNCKCGHGTFHQPSVRQWNHPATICATHGPSINISCCSGTCCQLPSTFYAATGTCVNFPCAVVPSINFPSHRGTFRQLSMWQWDRPSTKDPPTHG